MKDSIKMKTKICLVGESAVGKTSLIRRFVLDLFDDHYISTIGTKVTKRTIALSFEGMKVNMDMTIWDIMGHKGFKQLLHEAYFYGAQGVLAVCDITREFTLNDLDDWVDSVFKNAGKIPVVIAVNKSDLKDQAKFGEKELMATVKGFDSPYFFTSAKTGENVELAFSELARNISYKNIPSLKH
jgi:small GTP-binding protein